MKKVKNLFLILLVGFSIFTSNLLAGDVGGTLGFDANLKAFFGNFGLVPFFQSVCIMAIVLGVMTALKLSLDAFRNPYKNGGGGRR